MNLSIDYKNEMKYILKEEYDDFIACYNKPSFKGIRINTLKVDEEKFKKIFKIKITRSPFSNENFYLDEEIKSIGKLPLHHAGAFYVQEPSASSAVTALDPRPGENILDLCAAPGGKSTQIAAKLKGKGLLWCNEVVRNRAKILLSNIERMGVRNAVVSSDYPEILCEKLSGFFDRILVDAPCSGEGMFRKNPESINEWSKEHVKMCAKRQLLILNTAANALKENGVMVYSTCTFSIEENEQVVYNFLNENSDFSIENISYDFGRAANQIYDNKDIRKARRIFPQDGGEGHFVAKFRKNSSSTNKIKLYNYKNQKNRDNKFGYDIFSELFNVEIYGKIERFLDNFIILPDNLPNMSGLNILRAGILLATQKKSIIEPAHAVFMAASCDELKNKFDFSSDSNEILSYLKGEELNISTQERGYVGICVDGITTGYAKAVNGRLKNKYPKGLRNMN